MKKIIYCLFALFLVAASIFVISDNINVGAWSVEGETGNLKSSNLFGGGNDIIVNSSNCNIDNNFNYIFEIPHIDLVGNDVALWLYFVHFLGNNYYVEFVEDYNFSNNEPLGADFYLSYDDVPSGYDSSYGIRMDSWFPSNYTDETEYSLKYCILSRDWDEADNSSIIEYYNIMVTDSFLGYDLPYEPYGVIYYSQNNYDSVIDLATTLNYKVFNGSHNYCFYQTNQYYDWSLTNLYMYLVENNYNGSNIADLSHDNITDRSNSKYRNFWNWYSLDNNFDDITYCYGIFIPNTFINNKMFIQILDNPYVDSPLGAYFIDVLYADGNVGSFTSLNDDYFTSRMVYIEGSIDNPIVAIKYSMMPHDDSQFDAYFSFDTNVMSYYEGYTNGANEMKSVYVPRIDSLNNDINNLNNVINQLHSNISSLENRLENNWGWSVFFFGLLDIPLKVMSSVLNYDIMGVNLYSAFMGLLTALALIWILRKFLK